MINSIYLSVDSALTIHPHPISFRPRKPFSHQSEYAASSCGAGLEIRQSFMKLNTCVNMTEAADYYYYYDKIVGSKVSVCVSDGVEERTFTNPGCQGEYTFEKTIDSSTCAEEANPDDEMYKTWQSVSCNGQGPTSPPSASSGFSTTIQFTVTQVSSARVVLPLLSPCRSTDPLFSPPSTSRLLRVALIPRSTRPPRQRTTLPSAKPLPCPAALKRSRCPPTGSPTLRFLLTLAKPTAHNAVSKPLAHSC